MKTSNKSSVITGVILLLIAALFSISLLIQPLDFGYGGPGHNNIFYLLGNVIYTVYGFSSILIPVFLFVAGLSCFATTWTARKTMLLLTAVVPFFTAVITENICRSVLALGRGPFNVVKIVIAIVTGILLIIMEFLGTNIIADKINERFFYKSGKTTVAKETPVSKASENLNDEEATDFDTAKYDAEAAESAIASENSGTVDFVKMDKVDTSTKEYKETESIFDKALAKLKKKKAAKEEAKDSAATDFDAILDSPVEADTAVQADSVSQPAVSSEPLAPFSEINFVTDEEMNISEEELISQEIELGLREAPESNDTPISAPATPASAPATPDTADDDEPANPATIISQEEYAALTDFSSFDDNSASDELEWPDLPPAPDTLPPEYDENYDPNDPAFEFPPKDEAEAEPEFDLTKPAIQTKAAAQSKPVEEDSPYAATHYIDTVVENPNFPHGISLSDESVPVEPAKPREVKKSKFPSKISFGEENEPQEEPDYSIKPAYTAKKEDAKSNNHTTVFEEDENFDDFNVTIEEDSSIFDQIAKQEDSEDLDNAAEDEMVSVDDIVEDEDSEPVGFANAVSNVFSSMENDIRSSIPEKIPASANNLTADELTDFFNAQQEENRPKTQTIATAPKKVGNRATKKGPYVIPTDLLIAYKDDQYWLIDEATKQASLNLKQTLAEFNIEADIIGIKKGPVVTMFEILPAPGVKLSKIVTLQDNIALSLAAQSVRIVAPIPGKQAVGIEVPNKHRSVVGFREIIEMDLPDWKKMSIPVILGKDILGKAQLIDLAKTPHMLIAGATGSGKSVCVNSLILSILYKRSPQDVKVILVDPKVVELKLYNNIPHLLTPVITEPKKALQSLQWCLCEMERRYALLDSMGVRDISNYNTKIKEQKICTEKLPYIVVIIDEFADLMATSGKELESVIARLTAMSRAVGIHLVLATQRPSVNVITGLIKANIPTRIAFMVASRTDSNIIIDTVGAEKLLGRGDMLYASAADPAPIRIQGTFVTDQECEDVIKAVKEYGEPDYIDEEMFVESDEEKALDLFGNPMDDDDPLYDQALQIVVQSGKASASYLQRRLSIGYNRAARLVEEMEERGIVGPANGSKPREIIHIPS